MPQAMAILESVWRHLAYAARAMRQTPGFAMVAIVALSLGIGGNTIMFSVIRAFLLKPLEYRDPDRLVRVSVDNPKLRSVDSAFSLDQFEEMRSARSFSGFGAFLNSAEDMTLSGRGAPEAITGARVSANFLEILGVQPVLGRSFRMEKIGRAAHPSQGSARACGCDASAAIHTSPGAARLSMPFRTPLLACCPRALNFRLPAWMSGSPALRSGPGFPRGTGVA